MFLVRVFSKEVSRGGWKSLNKVFSMCDLPQTQHISLTTTTLYTNCSMVYLIRVLLYVGSWNMESSKQLAHARLLLHMIPVSHGYDGTDIPIVYEDVDRLHVVFS